MSTFPKLLSHYQQYELYEFLCAFGPHGTVHCLTDFINICQSNVHENYYTVRLTLDAKKAWQTWCDSLTLFLADTKSKVLINGALKVFDFIPKAGCQRQFAIYDHMLSDHVILSEIRAAACQAFEDFILKTKKMLRQFDTLIRINPLTVHDRQYVISDIYKFFLQTPEEYFQEIRTSIIDKLVHRMTASNIIFKFMDIKFIPTSLIVYENERSKQIAPIYSQTVFVYSPSHQYLIPQQFSYGPLKIGKEVSSLQTSKSVDNLIFSKRHDRYDSTNSNSRVGLGRSTQRSRLASISKKPSQIERDKASLVLQTIQSKYFSYSPNKDRKTHQDRGNLTSTYLDHYYRQQCIELQEKVKQLKYENNELLSKNDELRNENARLRLQNAGGDDQRSLYQQYWTEQLTKLKWEREKLADEVLRLRQEASYRYR